MRLNSEVSTSLYILHLRYHYDTTLSSHFLPYMQEYLVKVTCQILPETKSSLRSYQTHSVNKNLLLIPKLTPYIFLYFSLDDLLRKLSC